MAATTGRYSVGYLKTLNFPELPAKEQLKITTVGRPTPRLLKHRNIGMMGNTTQLFDKFQWLCLCEETSCFYCYPCLLYNKDWEGPLESNIESHGRCLEHMTACLQLALVRPPITANPAEGNDKRILEDVLDCIKPCGIYEQALEILLESKRLTNLPKNLTDDLSDCILNIVRDAIKKEVNEAEFVSLLLDDVSDISNYDQSLIFRYVHEGKPVERFWGFCSDLDVLNILKQVIDNPKKLTAQIFNPKFFSLGYVYRQCLSVQCPPHRPEMVLAKAINIQDVETRVFFARLNQITRYCPEENLATIYANRTVLERDLAKIRDTSKHPNDITTAIAILNSLSDPKFLSLLDLYGAILPHIETFHKESLLGISYASDKFTKALQTVQSLKGRMFSDIARCNLVLGFSKVRAFKSAEVILDPQNWTQVVSSMICEACNLYPFLNIAAKQVAVELEVLHRNQSVRTIDGPAKLFRFLVDNDLRAIVPNVYTLALLVVTAPVGVDQDRRKQQGIRRVLESCDERMKDISKLNAKVMLTVEKEFMMNLSGLNKTVIEAYHAKLSSDADVDECCSTSDQPEPSTSMALISGAQPVMVQIPRLLIQVPVPLPVQCKVEAEDSQSDQDEVPIDLISSCEDDEVKNYPLKSPGQDEKDPLAIGDEEYFEPKQQDLTFAVQEPPLKKAKPNF